MIERPAPVTDARRMRHSAADVALGATRGIRETVAERETGGDGRRERATGAVRVTAVDTRRAKLMKGVPVEQQIDDFVFSGPVSARDDDGGRSHLVNRSRRVARILR